jgi:hypothetical protein
MEAKEFTVSTVDFGIVLKLVEAVESEGFRYGACQCLVRGRELFIIKEMLF